MENLDKIAFRKELSLRLKQFVLDLIKVCGALPVREDALIIKRQLIRSGSSTYANYRAVNRARSKADFFNKLCIVVEEADETEMWIDLLIVSNISNNEQTRKLHDESIEILKIRTTIRKNCSV